MGLFLAAIVLVSEFGFRPSDFVLRPNLGPEEVSIEWTWKGWTTIGAAGLILLLTLMLGWLWSVNLRRKPLSPQERALQDLDIIARRADRRNVHSLVSEVVRRYLTEQYHVPAWQQTTAEFMENAAKTIPLPSKCMDQVVAILNRADEMKFSERESSDEEVGEFLSRARNFLEENSDIR